MPGAVHAGARTRRERIVNELFSGQVRPLEVSAGQTVTANVELAFSSVRKRFAIRTQNIQASVRDGRTDGHTALVATLNPIPRRPDGGFRRAVHIPDGPTACSEFTCELR